MNQSVQESSHVGGGDKIDWYPWGGEAFAKAEEEHKPMLIAIGTAADRGCGSALGAAARLTRRYFVPIQVDSGEHPDVAALYHQAAAMLTGQTEEALAVLADCCGNPFYVTAAPRELELAGLLSGTALNWNSDAAAYERIGAGITGRLARLSASYSEGGEAKALLRNRFNRLQRQYDGEWGGFGDGAKALLPQNLLFLLEYSRYAGERLSREMAVTTLKAMALSGVRDQIGGGFFRGTRDRQWREPILEKRLIDQSWMLDVYTRAYAMTGLELFHAVAVETADYVIRELRHSAGGFLSGQWSKDGHYLLTQAEVYKVLGENDGSVFCRQYGIGEMPAAACLYDGESPEEDSALLYDLRRKLYRYRLERSRPQRDEKLLLGWNGMMIAALARAGRVLGVERYLTAASNAEQFLRSRMVTPVGLRRYWCRGVMGGEGALEDYAGYAMGLYELYRCGCGGEYLRHAVKVMTRGDALFSDADHGGYFLTRGQRQLPVRPKQPWDTDVPSSWAVALQVLVRLAKEIGYPGLQARAKQQLQYAACVARSYDCTYALLSMMEA